MTQPNSMTEFSRLVDRNFLFLVQQGFRSRIESTGNGSMVTYSTSKLEFRLEYRLPDGIISLELRESPDGEWVRIEHVYDAVGIKFWIAENRHASLLEQQQFIGYHALMVRYYMRSLFEGDLSVLATARSEEAEYFRSLGM